ncbi:MAG: M48 family metalloprotease [Acidobacteriota bacterium]
MGRVLLAVTVLVPLLTGCAVNPVTGKSQLDLMGEAQELELGSQLYQPYIQQSLGPVNDEAVQREVGRVGSSLAAVSHRPRLPYEFTAINDPSVNAFALPGGKICITRGLLARLESVDGMAAVIGHEIGHVTARHAVAAYNRQILAGAIMLGAAVYAGTSNDDAAPLIGLGAMIGTQLALATYSRDQERQSDDLGIAYLVAAGYSPRGMVETHRVLLEQQREDPSLFDRMFASHPMSAERLATSERRLAGLTPEVRDRPVDIAGYNRVFERVIRDRAAWDLAAEGQRLLGAKKAKEGAARFADAARTAPHSGVIKTLHSLAMLSLKQTEDAIALADDAARLDGRVFVCRLVAGQLLVEPRPAEAITHLDAAESLLPGSAEVAYARGRAFEKLDRKAAAVEAYREARKRDPQGRVGAAAADRLRGLGAS